MKPQLETDWVRDSPWGSRAELKAQRGADSSPHADKGLCSHRLPYFHTCLFLRRSVRSFCLMSFFALSLFITLSVIILIFMKAFRAVRVGARSNKSFNLFPFCLALICPDVRHLYPAQTHLLLVVSDPPLVFKLSSPSHPCQYCCVFLRQPSALTLVSLCSPSCLSLPTSWVLSLPLSWFSPLQNLTIYPFITCTLAIFDIAKIKNDLRQDYWQTAYFGINLSSFFSLYFSLMTENCIFFV